MPEVTFIQQPVTGDSSVICPGSSNCPYDGDFQSEGVFIPSGSVTPGVRTVAKRPSTTAALPASKGTLVVCMKGLQPRHAACPANDAWEGQLWIPTNRQVSCYPGKAGCPTSGYSFSCSRNPSNPNFGEKCPGVPQRKWDRK